MIKKSIEDRYKKLTPIEHILKRPSMYIGNTYNEPTNMFIFDNINNITTNKFINKEVNYNAGLCKLFDEVLTNASDHYIRTKGKVKYIKIIVDKEYVSIENDGEGIPIKNHKEHKIYVPELIFGNLMSGENFDENDQRMVGGLNGLGTKLTNIFSKKFIVETADGKKKYTQTFTNNMSKKTKPKITKSKKNFTKITYYPDFERFDLTEITDEIQSIFLRRSIDIAAYSTGVKVYYNNNLIPIKSFKDYMKMFISDDSDFFYEKINDNWEIGISNSKDDSFKQVSMVNGISTHIGGTHVNYISNQIIKLLGEKLNTKALTIKPNIIKNNLFLFLSCKIPNPSFETQTKENLTTRMSNNIVKDVIISDYFIKKITSSEIKTDIVNFASLKEFQAAKKSTKSNNNKTKLRIAKLDDANKAGKNPYNLKCHLFITEGDSAASTAKRGFSVTGNDYFGLFPLKGKPLNVRDVTLQKMRDNDEISNIISSLGLEFGKKYTSTRTLRYGKVVIMSDMDPDGSHIKGLILNLFEKYWPELLELNFIYEFITPIVKVKKGKIVKYFYTQSEYSKWKNTTKTKGYFIKYYKGLGTIEPSEAKLFFGDIKKHLIRFNVSKIDNDRDFIDLAFNKKRIEDRKNWLLKYKPSNEIDKFKIKQNYNSFFNNEFIEFSMADNIRSIPSIVDGLKPSQRKILYTLFKRKFKDEVKVELLMGAVLEVAAYHHGPASLESTIIGMAQNFVGSNNINLLDPTGEYGTRLHGGKDASASRYIFTKLTDLTREIFNINDDEILDYLTDDGYKIEPKYYVPIIPMVLVNGSDGIGTGWSSYIPHFNPIDLIEYIKLKLKGRKRLPKLEPWFKNFKGEIIYDVDKNRYISKGIYKKLPKNKINILELPISMWNDKFFLILDKLIDENFIKDYENYCTDDEINIEIKFPDEIYNTLTDDIIIDKFSLETYISMNNMNLFDKNGKIYSYKDQYEIIDNFIDIRLKYYESRKQNILNKLNEQIDFVKNKKNFIELVLKKKIIFDKKTKSDIIKQIEKNNINKHNDNYDYLINIPLISLSKEKIDELHNKYIELKNEIDKTEKMSISKMWNYELNNLNKKLNYKI